MKTAILIPAYEPDEKLTKLVMELTDLPFPEILVVNDGSSEKCAGIFEKIAGMPKCKVLHHEVNKGKGAALKTGMKAILDNHPELIGCITVDADGQHLPEDIIQLARELEIDDRSLILGCRDFDRENVPLKSRLGNKITRTVYKLMTGSGITDTQTGLRAIPAAVMEKFLELPGDRYEFEMNMLMNASKNGIPIKEVKIQTVYIDDNRSSHFNPLLDSARIYGEILKFAFSSLLCSAIDIGFFTATYNLFLAGGLPMPLLGATSIARIISSGVNFSINRTVVFKNKENVVQQAAKYYTLCIAQMLASWLILEGLTSIGAGNVVILKIAADTFLFMVSFVIQRLFIFRRVQHEKAI